MRFGLVLINFVAGVIRPISDRRRPIIQRGNRYPGNLRIKDIGIEIGPVRPTDCADFRIDSQMSEFLGCTQGSKDAFKADPASEVNVAFDTVLKPKVDTVAAQ